MQTLRLIIAASALALLLPVAGSAQDADPLADMTREQRHEYLQGLSAEERQALRDQRRAQWNAMSEEERREARGRMKNRRDLNRGAMREQWNSMSEEERAAARQNFKAQREQRRETWNSLSPEQQAAARQQLRLHRDGKRGDRLQRCACARPPHARATAQASSVIDRCKAQPGRQPAEFVFQGGLGFLFVAAGFEMQGPDHQNA